MDVFEAIETTRAVRRYSDEPVTDDEIARCIHAAVHGPSGGNIQPWQFLAVTDPAVKRDARRGLSARLRALRARGA